MQLTQEWFAAAAESERDADGSVVGAQLSQQVESHHVDVAHCGAVDDDDRFLRSHRPHLELLPQGGVNRHRGVVRHDAVRPHGRRGASDARVDCAREQLLLEVVDVGEVERRREAEHVHPDDWLQTAVVPLRRVHAARHGEHLPASHPALRHHREQAGRHADYQARRDVDERHGGPRDEPHDQVAAADTPQLTQLAEDVEQREESDDDDAGEHRLGQRLEEGGGDRTDEEDEGGRHEARQLRATPHRVVHQTARRRLTPGDAVEERRHAVTDAVGV